MMRLVLTTLVLFALSQRSFATADGPDNFCVTRVSSNDVLNLRETPSASSAIVKKIPSTACKIKNLGQQADAKGNIIQQIGDGPSSKIPFWNKVEFEGDTGWAAIKFLKEDVSP